MNLFKQAQQLQARLAKLQEALEHETVEVAVGGGAVTMVINGQQRIQSVQIAPEAIDPSDVAMLEDLVLSAANEAIAKSQELAQKRLSALTGGLKLPGL